MVHPSFLILICLALSMPCLARGNQPSAKLYRWVDKQGQVHYSDTIPSEASKQERVVYEKSKVRKLKVLEKPKTRDELAREARLAHLRKEEKRLLEEQMARDRALLRTYRNEEDLQLALKGQVNTIDTRIKVLETNIKRQLILLESKIQQAAKLERNGQKVPRSLMDSIANIRQQIRRLKLKIAHEEKAKEELEEKFARDLERFRRLQTHLQEDLKPAAVTRPDSEPSRKQSIILSVVRCRPGIDCDRAWQLARIYVRTHATTPLFINSDTILHSRDPRQNDEIALTVARIHGKTEDTLFLDVRCRLSSVGQDLCHSDKVREIRAGFPTFIQEGLRSSSQ